LRNSPADISANEGNFRYLGFGLIIAWAAVSAVFYAQGQLHHDPSFLLVATRRWLNGATLYRDIVEINPPLIFYLTAPAVLLSDFLHVPDSTIFILFVVILAAVSLVWCCRLLARVQAISLADRYLILAACSAGLLVVPGYNFGQREHLFIIFALPYFLAVGFTPLGFRISPAEQFAIGAFAVFGFALKPFFVTALLIAAAARCWQQRSIRALYEIANLTIAAGCVVYLLLAVLVHPAYFHTVLPMAAEVYGAVANDIGEIPGRFIYPLLLIGATATIGDESKATRSTLIVFSSILFGLYVAFAAQRKIWDYMILPFDSMACVVAALTFALTWRRLLRRPIHLAILAAIPALILATAIRGGRYENLYADVFSAKLGELHSDWRGRPLLVLSTNVSASFPLINRVGARWVGSYPYQWLIAGALTRQHDESCPSSRESCAELTAILDFARRTNVDDFVSSSPDIVLIDERPRKSYLPDEDFDYIAFLKNDARFPAIWQRYTKVDDTLDYGIWLRNAAFPPKHS
jgi:hypothetical protein